MTKRIAPVLILIVSALGLWAHPAHSQTASSTSTPTATSSPSPMPSVTSTSIGLSAQRLLDLSSAAVTAKNTYHESSHETMNVPKQQRQVMTSQADYSSKSLLVHEVDTTKTTTLNSRPQHTKTQHTEMYIVKNRVPMRFGHKAWQCINLDQLSGQLGAIVSSTVGSVTIQSQDNLGQDTVDGQSVWHVRVAITVTLGGQDLPMTIDYYIAQSDYTMVRDTAVASFTLQGVTPNENMTNDYSRYGEAVWVKLPGACKGASIHRSSTAFLLPTPMHLLQTRLRRR